MADNSREITNIDEGTYNILEELQKTILRKLSPEDKQKRIQGLQLSPEGQDILREEKAVRINSNAVSILGCKLLNLNGMELRNRIIDFLNNGPMEYRPFVEKISDGSLSSTNLIRKLDGKTKDNYLKFLSNYALEIQTLTNDIGARLEALNQELADNNIMKQFSLSKTIQNGIYNYNCDEIIPIIMNHIDSNAENVLNEYYEIRQSLEHNKKVDFKKNEERDLFNVENKKYREELSNLKDIMEQINSEKHRLDISIMLGKGNVDEVQQTIDDLYVDFRKAVISLPTIVRDELAKKMEDFRGSVAFESVLDDYIKETSDNVVDVSHDSNKKQLNNDLDI